MLVPFIQRGSTLIAHLSISDTQFRQTTLPGGSGPPLVS